MKKNESSFNCSKANCSKANGNGLKNLKLKEEIEVRIPRVMLVGTGSGCGKTTVTCGILAALKRQETKVAAFKCGPDYIDPMFHSDIIGTKSRNLDLFLCGENTTKYLLAENSKNTDFSLIEGVMGMYDGLSHTDECSSNHVAHVTKTPEILIVSTKGKGLSLAAELSGFLSFRNNTIKGVIFNDTKPSMYEFYKSIAERECGLKAYGFLPHLADAAIESRHLGLVTAQEVSDLKKKMDILADACEKNLDIDGILNLGEGADNLHYQDIILKPVAECGSKIPIAIARDKAFCFYYEDGLHLLERLGAELIPFSPLTDDVLPNGIKGLILGGGYPEEYGEVLSGNKSMLADIRGACAEGIPVYAECGGYMYLCENIRNRQGNTFEGVGLLAGSAFMTKALSRFGYVTLTAEKDNLLCESGERINAHEFHYSDSDHSGDCCLAEKPNGKAWHCIHGGAALFAGYPHLHLWGNPEFAVRFLEKCMSVVARKGGGQWKF